MVRPREEDPIRGQATRLLKRYQDGDERALEELMPMLYGTLHGLASRLMSRERRDHTLQPTALVHEGWMKLIRQEDVSWEGHDHFLRLAALAMRRVLIDHARGRARGKRQANPRTIDIEQEVPWEPESASQLLDFDGALNRLERIDRQLVRIVELRFFAGCTVAETARLLDTSERTVERGWSVAKLWLAKDVKDHGL